MWKAWNASRKSLYIILPRQWRDIFILENNKSSQRLENPKTEDHKHSIVNIITAATLIAQVHTEIFSIWRYHLTSGLLSKKRFISQLQRNNKAPFCIYISIYLYLLVWILKSSFFYPFVLYRKTLSRQSLTAEWCILQLCMIKQQRTVRVPFL
jgi:hypothetical protein